VRPPRRWAASCHVGRRRAARQAQRPPTATRSRQDVGRWRIGGRSWKMTIDDEHALGPARVSGPPDGDGDEFARALFAPFRATGDDVPSLWWTLATAPAML